MSKFESFAKTLSAEKAYTRFTVVLLIASCLVLFLPTIKMRHRWFGELSTGRHQWLTAASMKYSNNWLNEGALQLRFGLVETPTSIESKTPESRALYASYPPGEVVPIYALSKITGHKHTPARLIMAYNLSTQFLTTLLLVLTAFIISRYFFRFGKATSILASLPVLLTYLFTPSGFYWFQNVYFSDQAVIILVALFLFFEVLLRHLRDNKKTSTLWLRVLSTLQFLVITAGTLTEWYFVFLISAYVVLRLITQLDGKKSLLQQTLVNTKRYVLPMAVGLGLFIIQLFVLSGWDELINKFRVRSGLQAIDVSHKSLTQLIFKDYPQQGFGFIAPLIIIGSILFLAVFSYRLWRKKVSVNERLLFIFVIAWTLIISTLGKLYFFRGHTPYHEFTMVLWGIPFALVCFGILPMFITSHTGLKKFFIELRLFRIKRLMLGVTLPLVICSYMIFGMGYALFGTGPHLLDLFPREEDFSHIEYALLVRDHTSFNDVVFSPDLFVDRDPPHAIAYSIKPVHKINDPFFSAIKTVVQPIAGEDYKVDLLLDKRIDRTDVQQSEINKLRAAAEAIYQTDNYEFFKIKKLEFNRIVDAP